MVSVLWAAFVGLVETPFQHLELVWGIVPLYFGLLLNELTSPKANFRTALQTGFSFLWAGAQWLYPYFKARATPHLELNAMLPLNLLVTFMVIGFGVIAVISGLRKKFPTYLAFLGQTRFANYFTIMIFPIQAHYLTWTWDRFIAIVLFGIPTWLVLHFGLMPLRQQK